MPSLPEPEPWAKPSFRLHPLSGVLTIAIDNLFFGVEVFTLELALPLACFLAFTITTTGVYQIQRRMSRDRRWVALLKALVAGVLAGAPTSISGTIFGAGVLLASGLTPGKGKAHLLKSAGTALSKSVSKPTLIEDADVQSPKPPERR